jgi:hypothetical protein
MSDAHGEPTIEATLLRLARERGPSKSICPSEVARDLASDWRPLMEAVRRTAVRLAATGRIEILRQGKAIVPAEIRGAIRLRIVPGSA